MTVGGIGGNTNAGTGASSIGMNQQGMDSYSKNLQSQITQLQKQLQELAKDDETDLETKTKKRQEIQKQIASLNSQLRQHQVDERRKAQQERQQKNRLRTSEEAAAGLSKNSMEAMISAEGSMKQAKIQGDTANRLQNGADIKRSEIRRDGGGSQRSADDSAAISSKWDDVESMEQHAKTAAASQISSLAEAQSKMSEANANSIRSTSVRTEEGTEEKAKEEGETETPVSASSSEKQSAEIGSNVDVKV